MSQKRRDPEGPVQQPSKLRAAGSSPAAPTTKSTPYRTRKGAVSPSIERLLSEFAHQLHTRGFYGRIEVYPRPRPGHCDICGDAVPIPQHASRLTVAGDEVFVCGHRYRLIEGTTVLCGVRCPQHYANPADEAPGHVSVEWPA